MVLGMTQRPPPMPLSTLASLIQGPDQISFARGRFDPDNLTFTSYRRARVVNGVNTGTKTIAYVWTTDNVSARQRQIIQEVFDRIDSRLGLDFVLVGRSFSPPSFGYGMLIDYKSDPPDFAGAPGYTDYDIGRIGINQDKVAGDTAFNDVVQHEIGHALGLKHPWEDAFGSTVRSREEFSDEQTLMAYRSTNPALEVWRSADIEALVDIWEPEQASGGIPASHFSVKEQDWIGEYGRALVNTNWLTIALGRTYANPVVIVSDPSLAHADPVVVRLRNVGPTSFQIRLQEPAYLDGLHGLESLSYVVMEAGDWQLSDGTRISAGRTPTSRLTSAGYDRVRISDGFRSLPTILGQVQTFNDPTWVSNRIGERSPTGFQLALQEEEALNRGTHGNESVGWLAIDSARANDGDTRLEAFSTGRTVTDVPTTLNFGYSHVQAPSLLTRIGSNVSIEPAQSRVDAITPESFRVRIQEDRSLDAETTHSPESISVLALDGEFGTLEGTAYQPPATRTVGEYGRLNLTSSWQTVTLSSTYTTPVVIVSDPTFNNADPAVVRLRSVGPGSFQMRLQEPNYRDGKHGAETVSWLVMEAGNWQLADGNRLSAGRIQTGRLSSAGFDPITFAAPFTGTPSVLTQTQTINGTDWVTTRTKDISGSGFRFALQEEEALNRGRHPVETIGWLAFDNGPANDGDTILQGGTTARTISSTPTKVSIGKSFAQPPALLAKLSSSAALDPANLRLNALSSTGFGVRVYEEKSFDAEMLHGPETVSWLALQGGAGTLEARPISLA